MKRALAIAGLLWACACEDDPGERVGESVPVVPSDPVPSVLSDPNEPIPPREVGALIYEDASGRTHHREGPYLVHFWATWCAPCVEELPSLLRAAHDEGVQDRVVALVVNPWPAVMPLFPRGIPEGVGLQRDNALALSLGVTAFPDAYWVDARGRAVRRLRRVVDWDAPQPRAWLRQLGE